MTKGAVASTGLAYLLVVMLVLIWGASWPITKIGLDDITPLWLTAIRVLLGAVCLVAILAWRVRLVVPARQDYPILFTVGVMQVGVALSLICVGLSLVPAGRSALINNTTPLWAIPMAMVALRERPTAAKVWGLALGMLGTMALFDPGEFDWTDRDVLFGNACLLGAAILWAGAIVHMRGHEFRAEPFELMPWQLLIGGGMLLPVAWWLEGSPQLTLTPSLGAVLFYNGFIVSAFSFWLFVTVARTLPAASTALTGMGEPVAGLGFSAWWLGEAVTGGEVASLLLIVGGVGLTAWGDLKPKERPCTDDSMTS